MYSARSAIKLTTSFISSSESSSAPFLFAPFAICSRTIPSALLCSPLAYSLFEFY